jgi:uncharacterized damage-inducible protein DinB
MSYVEPDLAQFRQFARYNLWANRRLYAACAQLPEAEFLRPRASFFGSLHATLNHILVADRLWMGRFTGHGSPGIHALDQILYPELAGLRVAREAEDARIVAWIDALGLPALNSTLRYETMTEPRRAQAIPLRLALAHFFNHETHHRGQAHGLLSQTAVAPPPLDLLLWFRETAPPA